MMAARKMQQRLIDRLPAVRGRIGEHAALGPQTWFKVGGAAEVLFRPADAEDLAVFVAAVAPDIPITVIGVGSNLLIRDGGVPGIVIRLGRGFANIAVEGDEIVAGAGALDLNIALAAEQAGLGGLEFLSGIPGTLGGALRMNAGAFGSDIKDVLIGARAIDGGGRFHDLDPAAMGMGYRHCDVPEDWIFVAARLGGRPTAAAQISARMVEIRSMRERNQPQRQPTGGSTFANPSGGAKAWELIDKAGCRGLRRGGAMVSEKHCNFLINCGDATAADIEGLGEEVQRRVKEATGVTLDWEIRRIGVSATGERENAS